MKACCLIAGLLVACCLSRYTPAMVWSKPLITRQTPGLRHGWPVLFVHCGTRVSHAEIALDHRLFLMPFCSPIPPATRNTQRTKVPVPVVPLVRPNSKQRRQCTHSFGSYSSALGQYSGGATKAISCGQGGCIAQPLVDLTESDEIKDESCDQAALKPSHLT
ncbi:hypothetical protein BGZ57DRAFT_607420 [Hyaloscypha finlandica]|nr:hypothetical protein BGZ57DRAFT_607420 [Hyaloscypha finlandica]